MKIKVLLEAKTKIAFLDIDTLNKSISLKINNNSKLIEEDKNKIIEISNR